MTKTEQKKAIRLLLALANWASDTARQQDPDEYRLFLESLSDTYFSSNDANEQEARAEAVVVFRSLRALIAIFDNLRDCFDPLDEWIENQVNSSCTIEAA